MKVDMLGWQVSNLELSQKLKELGVKQESLFCYDWYREGKEEGVFGGQVLSKRYTPDAVSAFSVAELGQLIGTKAPLPRLMGDGFWEVGFYIQDEGSDSIVAKTEADCRAKLLIYLIEKNYIKMEAK